MGMYADVYCKEPVVDAMLLLQDLGFDRIRQDNKNSGLVRAIHEFSYRCNFYTEGVFPLFKKIATLDAAKNIESITMSSFSTYISWSRGYDSLTISHFPSSGEEKTLHANIPLSKISD